MKNKKEINAGIIPDPATVDPETGQPLDLGSTVMEPDLESQGQATEAPEIPSGGEI